MNPPTPVVSMNSTKAVISMLRVIISRAAMSCSSPAVLPEYTQDSHGPIELIVA